MTFTLALLPALAQAGEPKISREGFDLWYGTYGTGRPVLVISRGPGLDCDYMEPVAQELAQVLRHTPVPACRGHVRVPGDLDLAWQ